MTYKKKLIEVALPLEAINRESAREKSIRQGHPSTLHLWWARRPLAACRAVIFGSLVDDPSAHPDQFPSEEAQHSERERLFRILEELVKWENITNETVLAAARAEIFACYDGNPPPVLDPFCGGGSIPLEAQRLGLTAYASDLNPVAVLITKALSEIPSRFVGRTPVRPLPEGASELGCWTGASGLAEDVRFYGAWMRAEAERRIGYLYPKVSLPPQYGGGEATVVAWIWARTVTCPNPACRATMPLVSSFWLGKKSGKEAWVQPIVGQKSIRFEIRHDPSGPPDPPKLGQGAKFRCLVCNNSPSPDYIHAEFENRQDGEQLLAVAAEGKGSRIYVRPDAVQEKAAQVDRPTDVLTEPARGTFGGNAQGRRYGFVTFADYFTDRQLLTLSTLANLVGEAHDRVERDATAAGWDQGVATEYARAVATYLSFVISRMVDKMSSLVTWSSDPKMEALRNTFSRQAISMTWDFAEGNPFSNSSGNFSDSVEIIAKVIGNLGIGTSAEVLQVDATAKFFQANVMVCTDPPYYDNIGYSDLSDLFYVWLRRSMAGLYPELFGTLLTPKSAELVADRYRFGSESAAKKHFESGFVSSFAALAAAQDVAAPLTFFYAFKQAEAKADDLASALVSTGWETMLQGILLAGLVVNGTWPVRTERSARSVGIGTNALASSIVLACRPREVDAPLATRKELLAALRSELPGALRHLQQGNIAPVDLAQAAIGPGMGVFSRYSKVVEADGRPMAVRTALALINQVLDETLAEQESDFDADTRWALAWFEQYGMNPGPFGVAETLSKAKVTAVNALVTAGFLESKGGKVRLLDRQELPSTWDPTTDSRLTVWEVAQHLIRALEAGGEGVAAELLRRVGGLGETARELAYRLYVLCERKKWAKEALAYNGLVVAWPEIALLAAGVSREEAVQQALTLAQEG